MSVFENPALWLGRQRPHRGRPIGFHPRAHQLAAASAASELLQDRSEAHMLCFAATGAGKTRCSVIPNLLQWPGSAVVIDVKKAELCKVTARRRREMGQQVVVLDPFEVTDEPPGSLSPLEILSLPTAQLEADSESITSLFAGPGTLGRDPFWDVHGSSILAAVIAHLATKSPELRTTSAMLDHLLCDDVIYKLAVLLDTVGESMPLMAYRDIASLLAMPDVTRGGVLATTQSYLKCLHGPGVLKSLDSTSFSLVDFILGKPMTIYIIMPVERIASHRSMLKLWIGTLLRAVACRSFRAEAPTLFVLDECGQLGAFPFLETFITLCRSYSCRVLAYFQDLSQLKSCYPASWETILNNCGIQAFGFMNRRLAEQWSDYFDATPAVLRSLLPQEQILSLPAVGEQITTKLDYLVDPEFQGMFDPNPLYQPASPGSFQLKTKLAPQLASERASSAARKPSKGSGSGGGRNVT